MMLWSSVLVAQVCVPHLGLRKQVSILPAYRSSSLQEAIQLLRKVVSMLHLVICTRMIGGGTCTILSKDPIGLEIRTLFIT